MEEDVRKGRMLGWGGCRVWEDLAFGRISGWGGCQVGVNVGLGRMSCWRGCWVEKRYSNIGLLPKFLVSCNLASTSARA